MRRAGALLACAAVLAMPAAASADDPPFINWNPLLPGFPTGYQPSKEKDCLDGSYSCMDKTLTEMYRRFDRLYATCDHNAVFALTYIRVTEEIRRAILEGFYEEPLFLNHEDAVFARMYFEGYDIWTRGDRENTADAWEEAFGAAREKRVAAIGNLLMSMNAHVNRDFPFMLANLGLTMPDGRSRKPDHDRGNEVLNRLYDDIFQEMARRFDPTILDYDVPGFGGDDTTLFQILQGWREQVWRHAEMLVHAPSDEARAAVAEFIENYAVETARNIESGSTNTEADTAARDRHCAEYRRTHAERGALAQAVIERRGLRARAGGTVAVRVACPDGIRTCDGVVFLDRLRRRSARRRAITAARLVERTAARARPPVLLARTELPVIDPGGRAVVRLGLARKALRALRRGGRFRIRARVHATTPWGAEISSKRRGRLRPAR